MTELTGCQHVRQSLGVYVLGAIDPAERAEVDVHLAGCASCREELAGLAGLPALLGHVPADDAARIAGFDENERLAPGGAAGPPGGTDGILTPLLARMAHRRRVNRWRSLAAAAAVVAVAAGAAIGVVSTAGPAPSRHAAGAAWEQVQGTDTATLAHMVVRYEGTPWGTRLDTSVTGIPGGTTCQFWVLGSHGRKWQAGGWTVTGLYQSGWYPGSSPVPESAVRGFEVTSGHTVLVRAAT